MRGRRDSPTRDYTPWSAMNIPLIQEIKIKGAEKWRGEAGIDLSEDYSPLREAMGRAVYYKITDEKVVVEGQGVVFLSGADFDRLTIRENGKNLWVFGLVRGVKEMFHVVEGERSVSRWDISNSKIFYKVEGHYLYVRYRGKNLTLKGVSSGSTDVHHLLEDSTLRHLLLHSSVCRPILRGNGDIKIYIYDVEGSASAVPAIEASGLTRKASHSVKTLTLDENQQLYLKTRGIGDPRAFYVSKLFGEVLDQLV